MDHLPSDHHDSLPKAIDEAVPPDVTHIGFIARSRDGKFLVTEPAGHPYGVSATWAKTKRATNERPHETLERCLREQIGVGTRSVFPITCAWATPNSTGFYFTGWLGEEWDDGQTLRPPTADVAALHWLTQEQALARLSKSANDASRRRDLGLLAHAAGVCVSPYRRMLLMVRELHLMGYERLRAPTYLAAVGAWRCPLVPLHWTLESHGGVQSNSEAVVPAGWFGNPQSFTYTSANEQNAFEEMRSGAEMLLATPRELARRFVTERPALALAGWGRDPEYARWFEDALARTAPNGVWYSFAEFQDLCDHLYTEMTTVPSLPLPPSGEARE